MMHGHTYVKFILNVWSLAIKELSILDVPLSLKKRHKSTKVPRLCPPFRLGLKKKANRKHFCNNTDRENPKVSQINLSK